MTGAEDAIDNYLVWELSKQKGIQSRILESSSDGQELKEKIVEEVRQAYDQKDYSLKEKKNLLRELDSTQNANAFDRWLDRSGVRRTCMRKTEYSISDAASFYSTFLKNYRI